MWGWAALHHYQSARPSTGIYECKLPILVGTCAETKETHSRGSSYFLLVRSVSSQQTSLSVEMVTYRLQKLYPWYGTSTQIDLTYPSCAL